MSIYININICQYIYIYQYMSIYIYQYMSIYIYVSIYVSIYYRYINHRFPYELDGSFGVWSHGLRNCQKCAEGLALSVTMPSPMQLWNQEVSSRSVRWCWIILNTYFIFFHHTFHFSVQMEINVHFFQKMIYKWWAFHISMWFFACNRIWSTQSVGIGRQNFGQFLNNHMFSVPARLQMVAMQYRSCRMQPGNGRSTQKETCRIFYQVHFQRQTVGFWQIRTKLSTS